MNELMNKWGEGRGDGGRGRGMEDFKMIYFHVWMEALIWLVGGSERQIGTRHGTQRGIQAGEWEGEKAGTD